MIIVKGDVITIVKGDAMISDIYKDVLELQASVRSGDKDVKQYALDLFCDRWDVTATIAQALGDPRTDIGWVIDWCHSFAQLSREAELLYASIEGYPPKTRNWWRHMYSLHVDHLAYPSFDGWFTEMLNKGVIWQVDLATVYADETPVASAVVESTAIEPEGEGT